jgi:hypothetical protein
MSGDCSHRDCRWVTPPGTPAYLAIYVIDLHSAYDCPQPGPAPSPGDESDVAGEGSDVER